MRPNGEYQPGAIVRRVIQSQWSPVGYQTTLLHQEGGHLRITHANGLQDLFHREYWEVVKAAPGTRSGFATFVKRIEEVETP